MFDFDDLEDAIVIQCKQPQKKLCQERSLPTEAFAERPIFNVQEEPTISPKRKPAQKVSATIGDADKEETSRPKDKKLRVLCLHGAASNSTVMRFQLAKLKAQLGREAEFTFLDALEESPSIEHDPTTKLVSADVPLRSWFKVQHDGTKDGPRFYSNIDEALQRVDSHIRRHGPYDVLMGFSQGCDLITMLSSEYEDTPLAPKLNVLWCPDHLILFKSSPWYRENCVDLRVPTVMVLGESDDLHYRAGKQSESVWSNPKVLEHSGDHKVPNDNREIMSTVLQDMRACLAEEN